MCGDFHIKFGTSSTSSCASNASPLVFSLEKISRHWIAKIVLGGQITCFSRGTLKTRPEKGKIQLSKLAVLMLLHLKITAREKFYLENAVTLSVKLKVQYCPVKACN